MSSDWFAIGRLRNPNVVALEVTHVDIDRIMEELTGGRNEVPDNWVPVTHLRKIQQQDGFLLWCKYWGRLYGIEPDSQEHTLSEFLSRRGSSFEERYIHEVFPEAQQVLADDHECRSAAGLRKSLEALHSEAQVLAKVATWSPELRLFGSVDLCARAGLLRQRLPGIVLNCDADQWIILDCKLTTGLEKKRLDLLVNSTQVRAYSLMLPAMLGDRGSSYHAAQNGFLATRDRPYNPLPVAVSNADATEIKSLAERAADIKINGWRYTPWEADSPVFPNFSNLHSDPWTGAKKQLLKIMRPVEILPEVGKVCADSLRAAGIRDLDYLLRSDLDELDLPAVPGVGPVAEAKIRAALEATKSRRPSPVPASILPPDRRTRVYLDFEFFPNVNCPVDDPAVPFPECLEGVPMIFLCGVGAADDEGGFNFQHFLAEREDHASEKTMLLAMIGYLEELGAFDSDKAIVFHWSSAEKSRIREAISRHGADVGRLASLPLFDLQRVFSGNFIAFPDCWGYGLKPISKAIGTVSPKHAVTYPKELSDAASAVVLGWEYYENPDSEEAARHLANLVGYLTIDCFSMHMAHEWLNANAEPSAQPTRPGKRRQREVPKRQHQKRSLPAPSRRTAMQLNRWATGWYGGRIEQGTPALDASDADYLSSVPRANGGGWYSATVRLNRPP